MLLLHRILVRLLLPRELYRRLGRDLHLTFEYGLEEARRAGRVRSFWLGEARDLVAAAVRLRFGDLRRRAPHRTERRWEGKTMGSQSSFAGGVADDLRHAVRSLIRSPGHSLFVVFTLALGVGGSTAIYGAIESVIIHPLPYENADRMVSIWRSVGGGGLIPAGSDLAESSAEQSDLFETVEEYQALSMTVIDAGELRSVRVARISATFFDFLGVEALIGRPFSSDETSPGGERVALIGEGLWRREYGSDRSVLGRSITLNGDPWTVIGVIPAPVPLPVGHGADIDVWVPVSATMRHTTTAALLVEGMTVEAAQERLTALQEARALEDPAAAEHGVSVMKAGQMIGARVRTSLKSLAFAVGLLLLIGCLNVSNLFLNRTEARSHETAVRVALGAGRRRIVMQHLLESLLLAGGAAVLGLVFAELGLALVQMMRPSDLDVLDRAEMSSVVLATGFGLSLAAGLIFGLWPAIREGRTRGQDALRSARTGSSRRGRHLQWTIVVAEVGFSFALLIGAGLLVRTMAQLNRVDPGFEPEGLLAMHVNLPSWKYEEEEMRRQAWLEVAEMARRITGVEAVSMAGGVPPSSGVYFGTLAIEGTELAEEDRQTLFFGSSVDSDYFATLRQPIAAGRALTEEEVREGAPVLVIGESAAGTFWPDGDAVGSRMRMGDEDWQTVVGVVADVAVSGLSRGLDRPQMYSPNRLRWSEMYAVVRHAGDAGPA